MPVAQLDRAVDYGSTGRWFESFRAHPQNLLQSQVAAGFLFFQAALRAKIFAVMLRPIETKTLCAALGALILASANARASRAQNTGIVPLRFKIGALLLSGSAAKDAAGSVVPAAEVDLHLPRLLSGATLSAGIQQRSKDGGKLRVIPLTVSKTFSPPNPVGSVTGYVYYGAGAGIYLLNGRKNGDDSGSKITLGGFAQLGYQLPNKFFIEGKYQLAARKVNGLSANGVLIFVGRSF